MLALTLLLAACAGDDESPSDSAGGSATAEVAEDGATSAGSGDVVASDAELWEVVTIVDGDTIGVTGPGGGHRVRLIGINTPEVDECFYDEATDELRSALGSGRVRLVADVSDTDQFGRLLRFVELEDGTDVGAGQVRGGFAVSRRYEPDVSRNDAYDALQAAAQADGRGRWAPDACGSVSVGVHDIDIEVRPDAPGDDNDNLNEEWVRFVNAGTEPVEITGWEIADESARHRYRFGGLVLAPGDGVTVFSGCGPDRDDAPIERYWCSADGAIWNNSGDTVLLVDANGNVAATHTYRT